MLFGVGIDIENHHRFLKYKNSDSEPDYLLSVFSQKELDNYAKYNSHFCFAISFSCKEAFFKAFGASWNNSKMQWTNIELFFTDIPENKKTSVEFSSFAKELIATHNIITPPFFDYTITESSIIFESILACKLK